MTEHDTLLARTFVDVADTLVVDFDVVDFLTLLTSRCVELFELSETALLLADPPRGLRVAASSSHEMRVLQLFEIQHDDGPSLDAYRIAAAVHCDDLRGALDRWPRFAPEALASGWTSVHALPMHLRGQTIGSLNLLRAEAGPLPPGDVVAAQALADVATIGILQHRAAQEHRLLAEQLQYALNSRVVVEQAKGVLAAHAGLPMDDAFSALRSYARQSQPPLARCRTRRRRTAAGAHRGDRIATQTCDGLTGSGGAGTPATGSGCETARSPATKSEPTGRRRAATPVGRQLGGARHLSDQQLAERVQLVVVGLDRSGALLFELSDVLGARVVEVVAGMLQRALDAVIALRAEQML